HLPTIFFLFTLRRPPSPPLFPYTTLFRSQSTINKDTGTSGQPTHEDAMPCSSTHLHESLTANVQEAQRILQICNACRYCEGFCAVFPAMTQRLAFSEADVHYLANLCHNCGACLHACQYAPP